MAKKKAQTEAEQAVTEVVTEAENVTEPAAETVTETVEVTEEPKPKKTSRKKAKAKTEEPEEEFVPIPVPFVAETEEIRPDAAMTADEVETALEDESADIDVEKKDEGMMRFQEKLKELSAFAKKKE